MCSLYLWEPVRVLPSFFPPPLPPPPPFLPPPPPFFPSPLSLSLSLSSSSFSISVSSISFSLLISFCFHISTSPHLLLIFHLRHLPHLHISFSICLLHLLPHLNLILHLHLHLLYLHLHRRFPQAARSFGELCQFGSSLNLRLEVYYVHWLIMVDFVIKKHNLKRNIKSALFKVMSIASYTFPLSFR
uniref:Uncharacterized protein n=1 Tax=Pipistrellus kuhlii TaxID=59472 RepID=A0A7J7XUQ0_PIPKU|nr:hypothetical protein mPipKuh1_010464 [Pipistrellus kuhlii]